ncbi:GNAT family N-acetyltransferase [Novosphingobium sp. 9]|uniref:GNAT family N-acetyltransferase n=1 Tax=Novosphingobium sp. 9 TaxID=2025349 RepID=UPI0021B6440A|nr:GNAT family N-acetyltransferase [Novosphingobium sp. 9]
MTGQAAPGATITTSRLVLRPALGDDLDDLHAVFAHPEAMRYWSRLPHTKMDETRDWLAGMIALPAQQGEDFVIEHEGRAIGKAGFWRFPELGFILHPAFWAQGLMREALEAVLARGFAKHRLPHATADVDPRNMACLGLLTRLGFQETGRAQGTWQVGEEWCDSVYLQLDAATFQSRTA